MVEITSVELIRDRKGYAIDVGIVGRRERRRYRYGSEAQAKYFAAVFRMNPHTLPGGFVRVRATTTPPPIPLAPAAAGGAVIFELRDDEFDAAFSELAMDLCG